MNHQLMRRPLQSAFGALLILGAAQASQAQTPPATHPDANAPPAAATPSASAAPVAAPEAPAPPATPPPVSYPMMTPKRELMLGENFGIRPGVLIQAWTEALQDRVKKTNGEDGDYQLNTYIRRARFFVAGTVFKQMTYLVLLEAADLGRTLPAGGKNFDGIFRVSDAYLSFNFHPAITVQAGLMLLPFCRNILQSVTTYNSLDILTTSATFLTATQTSALRDTGLQLKGRFLDEHLEYRVGMFQGIRQASDQMGAAAGKNFFRFTGYLQANFLDAEPGPYVFDGRYFGRRTVLGISGGFDYQKLRGGADAYLGLSAAVFANFPLNGDPKDGGDEISGLVQFLHFDPGTTLPVPPTPGGVAKQGDIAAELSYYNKGLHASVFGKYEQRINSDDAFKAANLQIIGGGLKYFFAEAAANVTLAYNHIATPDADANLFTAANQFVLALQLAYF